MSRIDERIQECERQRSNLIFEKIGLEDAREGRNSGHVIDNPEWQAAYKRGNEEGRLLVELDKADAQCTETQVG